MPKVNPLASYVEQFILNPGARVRPNLDDGNEETAAVVSKRIEGEESAKAVPTSLSKLRLQNAEVLADKDPRYRGKKVSRKVMEGTDTPLYDPELAKLCVSEGHSDTASVETDDSNDSSFDSEVDFRKQTQLSTKGDKKEKKKAKRYKDEEQVDDDYMRLGEDIMEDFEDDEEVDGDTDERAEVFSDEEGDSGVEDEQSPIPIKTFNTESTDHIAKGLAVKNQCGIFDTLFEARIGLQKVSSIANQLPQYDVYEEFLKNKNYPQYKLNLVTARKAIKKLVAEIIDLQETLLLNNSETKHILTSDSLTNEDDEVISSDEELAQTEEKRGTKRKIEEFDEVFRKRHKAIIPFRDETLIKWYEKAKLLVNRSRGNFNNFEVSPMQQIRNILVNKEQLLKRTQLLGLSRGNVCKIMGKVDKEQNSVKIEEYDPEIFDDSDFYTRMLEDVLKSKMTVSDDMTEVSRKWIDIQKLRKKAKKNVDAKASKGRKIRFEVMSKLQQFIGPCKPSQMDDDATNKLFSSLFGQSNQNYSETMK